MTPRSKGGFWGEFWPKALILVAIVLGLYLLEHYGFHSPLVAPQRCRFFLTNPWLLHLGTRRWAPTLGKLMLPERRRWPYWAVAAVCAALPDIDSVGYRLGVPYDSLWGHRGLTHSLLAAAVVAAAGAGLAQLGSSAANRPSPVRLAALLFLATASHGLLDAMTTGGLGVAFFSPWDLERYFFGFRPIRVSPISIRAFVSGRGLRVLASEALWVGLPCVLLLLGQRLWRQRRPLPEASS